MEERSGFRMLVFFCFTLAFISLILMINLWVAKPSFLSVETLGSVFFGYLFLVGLGVCIAFLLVLYFGNPIPMLRYTFFIAGSITIYLELTDMYLVDFEKIDWHILIWGALFLAIDLFFVRPWRMRHPEPE